MNFNQRIQDEDLGLYEMRLLGDEETAAIEQELLRSSDLRHRLAAVRGWLAVYAQSVDRVAAPTGSLERFMSSIPPRPAQAERAQILNFRDKRAQSRVAAVSTRSSMLPWLGWVAAALFAVASAALYRKDQTPPVTTATQPVPAPTTTPAPASQSPALPEELIQERDALKANVAVQATQIERLTAEKLRTQQEADTLRASLTGQSTRLRGEAAKTAEAQAQQDALRNTLTIQGDQVARLNSDAGNARLVTQALTDPTALRVTLVKPKSHPSPTGRATYLANRGTLIFLASNLAPLKSDKVYELWLIPADGSQPVPAGTFTPDERGNASVVNERFQHAVAAKGFSVTIENAGGAQVPTLPILLTGAAGA